MEVRVRLGEGWDEFWGRRVGVRGLVSCGRRGMTSETALQGVANSTHSGHCCSCAPPNCDSRPG